MTRFFKRKREYDYLNVITDPIQAFGFVRNFEGNVIKFMYNIVGSIASFYFFITLEWFIIVRLLLRVVRIKLWISLEM